MNSLSTTSKITFSPASTRFTPAVVDLLTAEYPGLVSEYTNTPAGPVGVKFNFEGPVVCASRLQTDLSFFDASLTPVPLENVTSRLDNLKLLSEGHKKLAEASRKLLSLDIHTRAAGLFLSGPPGVGKTHFSVGIAKEAMRAGVQVLYVTPQTEANARAILRDVTVMPLMILDDFHEPYGRAADFFKQIILKLHENGGRVFVTSNMPFSTYMEKLYFTNETDRQRWHDRTSHTLMPLELSGASQRAGRAWWAS